MKINGEVEVNFHALDECEWSDSHFAFFMIPTGQNQFECGDEETYPF
jgi:hypothetical protein